MLPPSSGLKDKQSKKLAREQGGSARRLLPRWFLASLSFSTLKMKVTCSSETSMFQMTELFVTTAVRTSNPRKKYLFLKY
jgi:hypothetical protein